MTDIQQTTGQCGRCQGSMYYDGLNWRHTENDRGLRECPNQGYRSDNLNVYFTAPGGSETWIAEADSEQWADHIVTVLNHWANAT